ncbi:3-dehydroquinate synthase [Allomuricauda ruestringensis DSM 13258]|uniref:3-dehydroquinate synthase n=1 Tax=Allomuricauda ruestringensis (strain DSM 13258 / CIP 107369 / LMG 19739 / B1) TaxID=886377 RepID=G2PKQ8_ALLRU|nr:3-dehydroquinate synthase [Allomuricauda ruestringensis]AEM72104.1 3-dehydroquinate synthase [Allomuricauda ruestringensis DSM 13258]
MESVKSQSYEVHIGELAEAALNQHIAKSGYSKIFVLVDENTKEHCLPFFKKIFDGSVDFILEIQSGEENKHIHTCLQLWEDLSNLDGDRKSLLINLGGGVLTDMGGFVASTFKRGIDFINIPTTLLSMVDASIGGKTGVDLGSLKNQIGVINQPQMVLIFPDFLKTLDPRQVKSGYAEMLKHGLIKDKAYWSSLTEKSNFTDASCIQKSIAIKNEVVLQDPTEKGLRKILNFGHTLGHAIESYCLDNHDKKTLLHGEAIAAGMILEGYLSHELQGLSKLSLDEIKKTFLTHFDKVDFTDDDIDAILQLLKYDKKNSHGNVNFVLLHSIGKAVTDIKVPEELFQKAFAYYKE